MSDSQTTTSHLAKPQPEPRSAYRVFRQIITRWMDNDADGHSGFGLCPGLLPSGAF